jgi:hypothetical protein
MLYQEKSGNPSLRYSKEKINDKKIFFNAFRLFHFSALRQHDLEVFCLAILTQNVCFMTKIVFQDFFLGNW